MPCGVHAVLCVGVAALAGCATAQNPGDPFVTAYRSLRPAVVLFTMQIPSDDKKRAARGLWDDAYGSGVIVASDAHASRILTAEHVIHGSRRLRATLDDRRVVAARVVAADEKDDLALVSVDVPNRAVARLGNSRRVEPGMLVGVTGYPMPDAFADEHLITRPSVFSGRVSSVRNDTIELDLPIIPGESGGPVFDATSGDVIALAESRFDDERAIGFAIPIDDAERFLQGKSPFATAPP